VYGSFLKAPGMKIIACSKHTPGITNKYKIFFFIFFSFLLLDVPFLLLAGNCFAEEQLTVITSDSLEYFSETKEYRAKGSVKIKEEDALIEADEIIYYEDTSEVVAEGDVYYDDKKTSIKARRAELNFEAKTGRLYGADIFFKKDNYYFTGKVVEKRDENYYYSPEASFTTCDSPLPEWCIKGKKVDVVIGESLKARDVSFHIKNIPVIYSPYLRASIGTERQTGFLTPKVGYSRSKGGSLSIPFFWAIAENRDSTFTLDLYSRRGVGAGIEYRFIKPGGITSNWRAYHIRDSELKKDFFEVRAFHENRRAGSMGGFLNINYVNEKEFFREYNPNLEIRTQRFLESTGEISAPFSNSRLYLLSQYWVDLKYETGDVPQRLPEVGYVLNYTGIGDFLFSSTVNAAHIWREKGISAGRLDIYPKLLYSRGTDYVVSQIVALRGTAYSFYRTEDVIDDSVKRLAFEYDIIGHTRLSRNFSSFMHVIEPSIRYHFISSSENNLPVFESAELFKKTSRIELSLLNRLIVKGSEILTLRVTQALDTYNGDRPFLPLSMEVGIRKPVSFKMDADFNVHTGEFEAVGSDLSVMVLKADLSLGQRYNRREDLMLYKTELVFNPYKSLQMAARLWYDTKGGGARDISLRLRYLKQCWGAEIYFAKKPGDYSVEIRFELTGLFTNLSNR
jgi:LPS-assembly protein